jgi:hypothetical protein
LGEDIPDGAGRCFVVLARTQRRAVGHVVEQKMPLVECIACPGKPDGAAPVLLEELD